jgi:8-oxo-dGTP pyrophosphatase MutT (NUDIX family)
VTTNQGTNKEELKMWMARRSRTKSKYPSYLDHIVAGGQPAGLGLMENVLKECMEEAGISKDTTLQGIKSSGAVSYETFEPSGRTKDSSFHYDGVVSRAVLFCYDLELPKDFIPTVVDGEVEEFFTWTTDQLLLSTKENYHDPIKPNCYLVIIDYLLRQGVISPESRGYLDIVRELRGGLCA